MKDNRITNRVFVVGVGITLRVALGLLRDVFPWAGMKPDAKKGYEINQIEFFG